MVPGHVPKLHSHFGPFAREEFPVHKVVNAKHFIFMVAVSNDKAEEETGFPMMITH